MFNSKRELERMQKRKLETIWKSRARLHWQEQCGEHVSTEDMEPLHQNSVTLIKVVSLIYAHRKGQVKIMRATIMYGARIIEPSNAVIERQSIKVMVEP